MIATEVAGLAVSLVSGALKLGKRLDEIQAEEVALRAAIPLAFPDVRLNPTDIQLKRALRRLLKDPKDRDTRDTDLDPLGADRQKIVDLFEQSDPYDELFAMCAKYKLIETIGTRTFKPDAAFRKALVARGPAWDLTDDDIKRFTYFVAAGPDLRANSLSFRIGATVLDVLSEVAAENMRFVISHEPTRRMVESVLTKFSDPDLAELPGWGPVLHSALRATLNTVIDEREALAGNLEWVERALSAVARARESSDNGDDFVIGLFQGRGMPTLLRGVLSEGAEYLSEADAKAWEKILSDVLLQAAEKVEGATDFEQFFQDHWHSLVGAGFRSLQEHGPKLLDEDEAILNATLTSAVGALADAFEQGPPNGETFSEVVEAAIAVFADPGLLEDNIREPWLRDMIVAVASYVEDAGLRAAFSQPALEHYAREALQVLSRYPEWIAGDSELVREILSNLLGKMAEVENFGVASLADAAVEGALAAIAENPDLLDLDFSTAIGQLAGGLAERVATGGISGLNAEAILAEVTEVIATNEEIFLVARDGLAEAVVKAVLDAADEDPQRVLVGTAIVSTVRRALGVVAARGKLLGTDLAAVEARVKELLGAGLSQASKVLGKHLAQGQIPDALEELIGMWARGEDLPDLDSPQFKKLFGDIADTVTAKAA